MLRKWRASLRDCHEQLSPHVDTNNTPSSPLFPDDNPDFYEDYMNDESNAYLNGEVRRLLNDHVENSQFVQSLESQFYQITYPVQLQRHGKSQGISTRDASKITEEQSQVQNDRKSNHVHRTSYRIKAFSHVFTVDLELNQ
ncbi:uncharacterized protein LOC122248809 [Penaeus japonicus]|uniref:uncharacterized protein LOC122248809 n=1 Tax=Penaeus japonicus TaxID=27405 RepID=UPI001C70FAD9|nr:uncharacterized protein LOC122248809 [Penaeus japonicus]